MSHLGTQHPCIDHHQYEKYNPYILAIVACCGHLTAALGQVKICLLEGTIWNRTTVMTTQRDFCSLQEANSSGCTRYICIYVGEALMLHEGGILSLSDKRSPADPHSVPFRR